GDAVAARGGLPAPGVEPGHGHAHPEHDWLGGGGADGGDSPGWVVAVADRYAPVHAGADFWRQLGSAGGGWFFRRWHPGDSRGAAGVFLYGYPLRCGGGSQGRFAWLVFHSGFIVWGRRSPSIR